MIPSYNKKKSVRILIKGVSKQIQEARFKWRSSGLVKDSFSLDKVYLLGIIFLYSLILYLDPILMLITSLFLGSILIWRNLYSSSYSIKQEYRLSLITFLNDLGLLTYIFRLYCVIFSHTNSSKFTYITYSTYLSSMFYVILSRYYFYNTMGSPKEFLNFSKILLLLGIFLCLLAFIFRLCITFSTILVFNVQQYLPDLWNEFLLREHYYTPNNVSINFSISNKPLLVTKWQKIGLIIGICTLIVGCITAYYSYTSYVLLTFKK